MLTSQQDHEQHDKSFAKHADFTESLERLDTGLKTLEACGDVDRKQTATNVLPHYYQLLRQCDQSFPLLLSEGNRLPLHREPTYLYLLPPITGQPEDTRWVLALYPALPGSPSQVQLLVWESRERGASIKPIGPPREIQEALATSSSPPRIDERCNEITMQQMGNCINLLLRFQDGELSISARPKDGIRTIDWAADVEDTPGERQERHAYDDMKTILKISHGLEEQWQDDRLFLCDRQGHPPITVRESFMGQINGADSPAGFPHYIYLASSRARVFRINSNDPQAPPVASELLGGVIHDVLAVSSKKFEDKPTILAAAYDGFIYLLQEEEIPGQESTSSPLRAKYWQDATSNHISRLLGNGSEHILALDQHHNLHPLRVNDPQQVEEMRDRAVIALFDAFGFTGTNGPPMEAFSFLAGEGERKTQYEHLVRLVLEGYILNLSRSSSLPAYRFQLIFMHVKEYGKAGEDSSFARKSRLHFELQQRIWDWMKKKVILGEKTSIAKEGLGPLWELLGLENNAPDWLWMSMFRKYDWGQAWLELQGIKELGEAGAWLYKARRKRKELLPAMHRLRPLTVRGSMRLGSQARHIRELNPERRWFVMVEYRKGLRVVEIPDDSTDTWETVALLPQDRAGVFGLPMTIASGPDLTMALGMERGAGGDHILVGTDRGEVMLYRLTNGSFVKVIEKPIDIDFHIMCCQVLVMPNHAGVLFGGKDKSDLPILYWLPFRQPGASSFPHQIGWPVWRGERKGSIRMLALTSENMLWVVDREGCSLLNWRLGPRSFYTRGILVKPEERHEIGRKLYCLAASSKTGQSPIILCGGKDGQALALDGEKGELQWNAGCGNVIRRVLHIPEAKSSPLGGEGLWVVCGDHDHVLMIDNHGQLVGVLESMGPVTAICRFGDSGVLLGGLDGRLVLVSCEAPPQPQEEEASGSAEVEDPAMELRLYPLRVTGSDGHRNHPIKELCQALKKEEVDRDESLTALSLLETTVQALGSSFDPTCLLEALEAFLHPPGKRFQPPTRVAWLLFRLSRDLPDRTRLPVMIPLVKRLWESTACRDPNTILCQMINPMLVELEEAAIHGNGDLAPEARRLLDEINRCVWKQEWFEDDECPKTINRNDRLKVIRSSQMLRRWARALENHKDNQAAMLVSWCDSLVKVWAIDDPGLFAQRLRLFFEQQPLIKGPAGKVWLGWLETLTKEGEGGDLPKDLAALENVSLVPWSSGTLHSIMDVWPSNKDWVAWLEQLQGSLKSLHKAHALDRPHAAWRERQCLSIVDEHIIDTWGSRFSLASGNPLLALWGPRLAKIWGRAIEARMDALDRESAEAQDKYLEVRDKTRWQDSQHVDLELTLWNLNPRGVSLEQALWNGAQISSSAATMDLPASEQREQLTLSLTTTTPDVLDGVVSLRYVDTLSGRPLRRDVPISERRGLSTYHPDTRWQPTWDRLQRLLKAGEAEGTKICWIDGHLWPSLERERLKVMVTDQYAVVLGQNGDLLDRIESGLDDDREIFCPDIAFGSESAEEVVEQLHPLFQNDPLPCFSLLALAVWQRIHPLPQAVAEALQPLLPEPARVEALLLRLLGSRERVELFDKGLRGLPAKAIGAWCFGDPLYAGASSLPLAQSQSEELYASPASLLGGRVWESLDRCPVAAGEIAHWLGQEVESAEKQRIARRALSRLWSSDLGHDTPENMGQPVMEEVARAILRALTWPHERETLSYVCSSVYAVEMAINIQHEQYGRVYMVMPGVVDGDKEPLAQREAGVWLTLGSQLILPHLSGIRLTLGWEECLRLIHVDTPMQATLVLNEVAAGQHTIRGERVFRTSNGMTPQAVAHHFSYRQREIDLLMEQLRCADQGGPGAALIIGGRRMGKTSLRQRFLYELSLEEEDTRRPYFEIDFQGLQAGLKGLRLEYEFFRLLRMAMEKRGSPMPRGVWIDPDNSHQRDHARLTLEHHLKTINARRGKTLLFFDETDHLARADAQSGFEIFHFLRYLISSSQLCLFATIFPFSASDEKALNIAMYAGGSPMYNTFPSPIRLGPWSPDHAWEYLRAKMAGFGLVLPGYLREEALRISRGVPWVVHALGLALCHGQAKTSVRRRVIMGDEWREASSLVCNEIYKEMYQTVRSITERSDRDVGLDTTLADARCLSGGALWSTLVHLASGRDVGVPAPGQGWPEKRSSFHLNEVMKYLDETTDQERVQGVLNQFTATTVLEGDDTNGEQFYFANNLLPAWAALGKGA